MKIFFKDVFKSSIIMVIIIAMLVPFAIKNRSDTASIEESKKLTAFNKTIIWDGQEITLFDPIYQVSEEDLGCKDVDVISTAVRLLGKNYFWASKGGDAYHGRDALAVENVPNIDCSGLIWWTLKTLQQEGKEIGEIKVGQGDSSIYPIDSRNWLMNYTTNNSANWLADCGHWERNYDEETQTYTDWEFIPTVPGVTNTAQGEYEGKKVNILKLNDPITADYRWYNYVNKSGEIDKLPAGTIVIAAAEIVPHENQPVSDHCWISLGDLGTTNKDEAVEAIKEKYGIDIKAMFGENWVNYVQGDEDSTFGSTTCTYWRIESSGVNGSLGVRIDNGDPDFSAVKQVGDHIKGVGPIWAFQVASGEVQKSGSFGIKLVKYEDGTDITLSGATFKVEILGLDYTDTQTTGPDGIANFKNADIKEEGTYDVTVTEEVSPGGYIGITEPIKFQVTTQLVGDDTYKLVPNSDIVLDNARNIDVSEGVILIEAENRTTSIDIHKGVKSVENQDSGYYAVAKAIEEAEKNQAEQDENVDPSYEDEKTGKKYTEEELKDIAHEWVVETTIPEDIGEYKRYMVTDPVDTSKLEFSGLDRVKVELIDSNGNVTKTLVKGTDYEAVYENDILSVTYIDKKDGNTFYGEFLSEATTSNKIRLTFNTTFKVNPETGKLAVLDGIVTNAENQATLKYDNGSDVDREKKSENPEVHTGAVSIFKYEDTNGNGKHDEGEKALVGAEFKIALSEDDAKNGNFVKIGGKELIAVSNEHGIATFTGLSFGGDAKDDEENLKNGLYGYDWEKASRDYYIVETKTPAGYEKMTEILKTTVSKDSSEKIDITDKINELDSIGNKPLKFDLALRKWVTHAYVTENGQTVEYKTGHKADDNPEAVVKVDLKKSKLNEVTVKFKYSIRITNEGQIAGEAREITDYIPAGLKFVQEDNPDWTTTSDERIVKTRKLEGVTLKPDESAEVEIMLTWVNSKDSMGVMTNTAEISEDYNEYGVHDIDSTPNNKKPKEDDIDDAPVMLAIKTGSEIIGYTSIGLGFVTIVTAGVLMIKRKFTNV